MMIKWYVYFIGRDGMKHCHCFENEEQQAVHFAFLVNGEAALEINGHEIKRISGCRFQKNQKEVLQC